MKLEILKNGWNKMARAPRGRTALAGGAIAACLAIALSTGIGAGDPPAGSRATIGGTKVDLAEDENQYTVTIVASDEEQSRLQIRMEGRNLLIGSAETPGGAKLEQNVSLPEADARQSPKFDKQGDRLVVTVPKAVATPSATVPSASRAPGAPLISDMDEWTGQVLGRFERMQRQMDRMMNHAMSNFGQADPFAGLGDFPGVPAMGGANLKDEGNEYVIRADVPGGSLENVKVTVDNERVLKITAQEEVSATGRYHTSNFTQVLTLPGPVQSDKIQVDQKDGGLVITLPKA